MTKTDEKLVTEAMIEAGLKAYRRNYVGENLDAVERKQLAAVFRAMHKARPQPQGHPELVERLRLASNDRTYKADLEALCREAATAIEATGIALKEVERERDELREALEECRLIVANLPHGEDLLLRKIDQALSSKSGSVG
jgi:hypothetical protein